MGREQPRPSVGRDVENPFDEMHANSWGAQPLQVSALTRLSAPHGVPLTAVPW